MEHKNFKKPNLFLAGQPRCGTSALHNFLDQHPEIFMSPAKEPHHFCKDIIEESDAFYKSRKYYLKYRNDSDYLALFKGAVNEKIIGESTANYLYSEVSAEEIYKFNPDAKIVMILREPVSFLYSWYGYLLSRLQEDAESFEKALQLEQKRKTGENIPQTIEAPSRLYYSERIKYKQHLERFFRLFDNSRIKVIIYEDFKRNNQKVYKNILEFLNVDSNFTPDFSIINKRKNARHPKLNRLLLNPFLTKILLTIVPVRLRAKIKQLLNKILFSGKPKGEINPQLRKKLMMQYKPQVVEISSLLNIDLVKKWGYDKKDLK